MTKSAEVRVDVQNIHTVQNAICKTDFNLYMLYFLVLDEKNVPVKEAVTQLIANPSPPRHVASGVPTENTIELKKEDKVSVKARIGLPDTLKPGNYHSYLLQISVDVEDGKPVWDPKTADLVELTRKAQDKDDSWVGITDLKITVHEGGIVVQPRRDLAKIPEHLRDIAVQKKEETEAHDFALTLTKVYLPPSRGEEPAWKRDPIKIAQQFMEGEAVDVEKLKILWKNICGTYKILKNSTEIMKEHNLANKHETAKAFMRILLQPEIERKKLKADLEKGVKFAIIHRKKFLGEKTSVNKAALALHKEELVTILETDVIQYIVGLLNYYWLLSHLLARYGRGLGSGRDGDQDFKPVESDPNQTARQKLLGQGDNASSAVLALGKFRTMYFPPAPGTPEPWKQDPFGLANTILNSWTNLQWEVLAQLGGFIAEISRVLRDIGAYPNPLDIDKTERLVRLRLPVCHRNSDRLKQFRIMLLQELHTGDGKLLNEEDRKLALDPNQPLDLQPANIDRDALTALLEQQFIQDISIILAYYFVVLEIYKEAVDQIEEDEDPGTIKGTVTVLDDPKNLPPKDVVNDMVDRIGAGKEGGPEVGSPLGLPVPDLNTLHRLGQRNGPLPIPFRMGMPQPQLQIPERSSASDNVAAPQHPPPQEPDAFAQSPVGKLIGEQPGETSINNRSPTLKPGVNDGQPGPTGDFMADQMGLGVQGTKPEPQTPPNQQTPIPDFPQPANAQSFGAGGTPIDLDLVKKYNQFAPDSKSAPQDSYQETPEERAAQERQRLDAQEAITPPPPPQPVIPPNPLLKEMEAERAAQEQARQDVHKMMAPGPLPQPGSAPRPAAPGTLPGNFQPFQATQSKAPRFDDPKRLAKARNKQGEYAARKGPRK